MSTSSFQKTSFDWQVGQVQRRVGEAIERFFSNIPNYDPNQPTIPEWLINGIFWLVVGGLAGWLTWQLFKLLRPLVLNWMQQRAVGTAVTPPVSLMTAERWLSQARSAQQQGNYREACRCLYQAMLIFLNDRAQIRGKSSRTDGEYLQLVQTLPQPQPYCLLLQTHEQLCFSDAPISAEVSDRCWQAYREIEQQ